MLRYDPLPTLNLDADALGAVINFGCAVAAYWWQTRSHCTAIQNLIASKKDIMDDWYEGFIEKKMIEQKYINRHLPVGRLKIKAKKRH